MPTIVDMGKKPQVKACAKRCRGTVQDTDNGSIRQRDSANLPRGGNAPFVSRLRDERDRRACASRRPRWPEAGAPARAVRDARTEQRLEPSLQEVSAYCRRRDR